MSSTIDKNDVDITKLFYYKDTFELEINGQTIKIYMRLVGDAELNQARIAALRESANLRKKLKDRNSDESQAYFPDLTAVTKEELINALLSAKYSEIVKSVMDEKKIVLPPEPPSDADLETQEEYQKEVDNFDAKREKEIIEEVNNRLVKLQKEYESFSKEQLEDEYLSTSINQLCEYAMIQKFKNACTYFGTFKDSQYKRRMFNSLEEFENLPTKVKEAFNEFYSHLDIHEVELKKSPAP